MGKAAGDRHLKIFIKGALGWWGVPIQHPPPMVSRVGHAVFLVHWVLMSGVSIFLNLKPWVGLLGTGT